MFVPKKQKKVRKKNETIGCYGISEMLLSKFFVGKKSTTAKEAMLYVKGMMQGEGVRKSEIREARKRLSIGTEKVTEGYVWSWENPIDPEIMWKIKSEEFMT